MNVFVCSWSESERGVFLKDPEAAGENGCSRRIVALASAEKRGGTRHKARRYGTHKAREHTHSETPGGWTRLELLLLLLLVLTMGSNSTM